MGQLSYLEHIKWDKIQCTVGDSGEAMESEQSCAVSAGRWEKESQEIRSICPAQVPMAMVCGRRKQGQ